MKKIMEKCAKIIVYESTLKNGTMFFGSKVVSDLNKFKELSRAGTLFVLKGTIIFIIVLNRVYHRDLDLSLSFFIRQ